MEKFQTTKTEIINAVKEFPESRKLLEKMFPNAFVPESAIQLVGPLVTVQGHFNSICNLLSIEQGALGLGAGFAPEPYKQRSIFVGGLYDWKLVSISGKESKLLVPYKI